MKHFFLIIKCLIFTIPFFLLISCGDNDGKSKISKGHREAIKIQCEDASNKEACNLEVRSNFINEGNEYANFEDLNDDQIESIKWSCVRSRKYGLVAYNECLLKFTDKTLGGTLFAEEEQEQQPASNIEKLEQSVVYIEIALANHTKKQDFPLGNGSGVIISDKKIATNCHVAMIEPDKKDYKFAKEKLKWDLSNDDVKIHIWIKTINGKDWAEATLVNQNVKKDVCIIKHNPKKLFKVLMKPIKRFGDFEKLKKGSFVRAIGSPGGMIGFTSTGDIQWLGTAEALDRNFSYTLLDDYDQDTKFIVHSAKIHGGSSGGPLFDNDGKIIGLNTLGSETAAENIAVSADHIKDLLYNN